MPDLTAPFITLYSLLACCLALLLIILWRVMRSAPQGIKLLPQQLHEQERRLSEGTAYHGDKLHQLINTQQKESLQSLNDFEQKIAKQVGENIEKIAKKVEDKLELINSNVETRLNDGLKRSNETFASIIARLAKIDEAQRSIEGLSSNIVSLQDILTDKKTRGTFGEVQLENILSCVFGAEKEGLYQMQYRFNTGLIADAVLFAPEPIGLIAIDSKFPLENYKRSVDRSLSDTARNEAARALKKDIKKHIDDISSKYIIEGTTSPQAILFLPAEAIFAELNAYYGDSLEYAQQKRVWLASPTTLMAVLNTLQVIYRNAKREKYAKEIHNNLIKLGEEFERYQRRWNTLANDISKVTKDIKEISTTSDKISHKFEQIQKADTREIEEEQSPLPIN